MKLGMLLSNIEYESVHLDLEKEIKNLSLDSRDTDLEGSMYFAVPGSQVDGHTYISEVIEKGAQAIVCEVLPEELDESVSYIKVVDVSLVMGKIASAFYGNPSDDMTVIGVTGTNGKTTVATLMYQVLDELGYAVSLLSTIENRIGNEVIIASHTTADALSLQKYLADMKAKGSEYVCMEVSSHALDQGRVGGIDFDYALFTNLSPEHLDYHENMDEYAAVKKGFFDALDTEAVAVVNIDDAYGSYMVSNTQAKVCSYALHHSADYRADQRNDDILFNNKEVTLNLHGDFNVYNMLAVYAALSECGIPDEKLIPALAKVKGPRGRMERVESDHCLAFVDYAHTPDAVKNVLETIQEMPHARIITVLGCGGDRDVEKRPLMAGTAQKLSDYSIFTSDNPRTESQEAIFADMKKGLEEDENYIFITDRDEAIAHAVENSSPEDIILVAGKGHEDYQIIGTEKHHFDDAEILEKYLAKKTNN